MFSAAPRHWGLSPTRHRPTCLDTKSLHNRPMQNSFPVDAALPDIFHALAAHGRAVLTAAPGSGKTTRVPLALAGLLPAANDSPCPPLPGKILVLEPRRLAARAAARYMSKSLGESVGERVGYSVRLESRVSKATRVELLTEGMFTRRLLADPELAGVSCVVFDEFHERSLQADFGLALCLESLEALRPDLRLLVMSATLDTEAISRFLGGCPVVGAEGRSLPVEIRHAPPERCVDTGSGAREIAAKAALAVHEALRQEAGSVLVFLPGRGEITLTAELLAQKPENVDLHPLYGDLPPRVQDAAIAPPPPGRRKVVLATDIAQTSLTIEGVRIVIDAGLARSPRFEPSTGLSRLATTRLSQDAADQRAGRAGRTVPGVCLRLWPREEYLIPQARPEILDADLAGLFLDALIWGSDPATLPWLTPPPETALHNAAETLSALQAARPGPNSRLVVTPHGQRLARLPLHPRPAHMVLSAAEQETDLSSLAACLAAVVSERDPLRQSAAGETASDIRLRLPLLRRPENKRLREAAEQVHRSAGLHSAFRLPEPQEEDFAGMLLSLAWPDRIARRRSRGSFLTASGRGAELPAHDPLADEPWLVAASLGGGVNRRIHLAAPVALADILRLHAGHIYREEDIHWDSKSESVICRSAQRLGAVVLQEGPLPPSPELNSRIKKALLEGFVSCGAERLPWTDELRSLQARVLLLRGLEQPDEQDGAWPDLGDAALLQGLSGDPESTWLSPWLDGATTCKRLSADDFGAALRARLPWPLPERLDREAPVRLALPSGSSALVDYLPVVRGEPPVLAVKLQEMFGQTDTPRVAAGRVPVMLHLLSPAGRPLQVTRDLRHFWTHAYKQVRAEMRGRYPKHPWPDDPLQAIPTGKTKKRLEAEHKT